MAGIRQRYKRAIAESAAKQNVPHLFLVRNMFLPREPNITPRHPQLSEGCVNFLQPLSLDRDYYNYFIANLWRPKGGQQWHFRH
jgi:hypothetical protein